MADIDNIELRSEKTRQIIGMVPSGIVRYGTLIITIIIAVLLAVSYFVPYPENLQANATVVVDADGKLNVRAYILYSHINAIHEGMSAEIEFEGWISVRRLWICICNNLAYKPECTEYQWAELFQSIFE